MFALSYQNRFNFLIIFSFKSRNFRRGLPQFFVVSIKNLVLIGNYIRDLFKLCKYLLLMRVYTGWGLILGYPTILIPGLQSKNNNASQPEFELGEEEISWISSILPLFVPLGSLISAVLMDRIGKRRIMQVSSKIANNKKISHNSSLSTLLIP